MLLILGGFIIKDPIVLGCEGLACLINSGRSRQGALVFGLGCMVCALNETCITPPFATHRSGPKGPCKGGAIGGLRG